MDQPGPFLLAALDYARDQLPVFPVQPRGKAPLTAHGLTDATTDPTVVERYWSRWPDANIGLAIPLGLVVVDIDDRHAFDRLKAEDRELPATARSQTGRGFHLFYRTEAVSRNAVKVFPGVDLRGVGGYVVVPPSTHSTGTTYRWQVPLSQATIADAPAWLVATLTARSGGRARSTEKWREAVSRGANEGERNDSIAALAGHLLRRGIDPFVTLDLLVCWNLARCRPPLTDTEVAQTVDSIAGRELRRREGCTGA